jgi:hypothetical protein
MSLPFDYFNVFPTTLHPHEPCLHCSSPYHSLGDCPHWGQFSKFSNEQLNTSFSSPGFESNSNFYNLDWSNHSDFYFPHCIFFYSFSFRYFIFYHFIFYFGFLTAINILMFDLQEKDCC